MSIDAYFSVKEILQFNINRGLPAASIYPANDL